MFINIKVIIERITLNKHLLYFDCILQIIAIRSNYIL